MIQQHAILTVPADRAFYSLRFIPNNHNQCSFEELADGTVQMTLGLCNVEDATLERAEQALAGNDTFIQLLHAIQHPVVTGYILEDGQSILAVASQDDDEREPLSLLIQEGHASYRNAEWDRPFYPYWEA